MRVSFFVRSVFCLSVVDFLSESLKDAILGLFDSISRCRGDFLLLRFFVEVSRTTVGEEGLRREALWLT